MSYSIEPYRIIQTPKELNLLCVDKIETPRFSMGDAATIAARAPAGGVIIVIVDRIDAYYCDVLEHCKICFKGLDRVVYANIERDIVIDKDNTDTYRTYHLKGALNDDEGIPGDFELYLAALCLTKNDYSLISHFGSTKAWLKKQGIPPKRKRIMAQHSPGFWGWECSLQ
jgi:hypothetical protein